MFGKILSNIFYIVREMDKLNLSIIELKKNLMKSKISEMWLNITFVLQVLQMCSEQWYTLGKIWYGGMSANEKAKTRYFANKFDYHNHSNNYIGSDSNF